jgi:ubiquinone/menaquinone biosynthesis C-methylase UbiE
MDPYTLERGDDGARRLRRLARVTWPTTRGLLRRAGLQPGWSCLDVGCGTGRVTLAMARRLGPTGRAEGVDSDPIFIDRARSAATKAGLNAIFRVGTADQPGEHARFDLVYARFLLTHLADPSIAARSMLRVAKPGGVVVVEDIDFAGSFCHPPSPAFDRYVALYRAVVRSSGGDPEIGPRLGDLLEDAGLTAIRVSVVQPTARQAGGLGIASATMRGIAAAVVSKGLATLPEVTRVVDELETWERSPRAMESLPRIFQVWGVRPG